MGLALSPFDGADSADAANGLHVALAMIASECKQAKVRSPFLNDSRHAMTSALCQPLEEAGCSAL